MLTTAPKGTYDILPGEVEKWQRIEEIARDLCRRYGYSEIRTPMFEHTELFKRGVGEATDIVGKEMYTFLDKGNRSISLRPEGTAGVVRAFVEHKLYGQPLPQKYYYIGPFFRYERMQAGRSRQFSQFGVEVFGSKSPAIDAEVIALAWDFYKQVGLKDVELQINSVGCQACRPAHREALVNFLKETKEELCPDCQVRLEKNPLRVLDCKNEKCRKLTAEAPVMTDHLCPECAAHFQAVKEYLEMLKIPYTVNNRLVRGLDYYTNTAFEFISTHVGAQNAVGGGGRYDGLVETVGGPSVPGIGFGLGIDRLLLALENQGVELVKPRVLDVYVVAMGDAAEKEAFRLTAALRAAGLSAEKDTEGKGMKAQLKQANRLNAAYTVILGEDELARRAAGVKNMETGEQVEVELENVPDFIMRMKSLM